jgi:imidazolonepropionase-like amidohydrolase
MKTLSSLVLATGITLLATASQNLFATDIIPAAKQQQTILIKGGTLHTVTDGVKANHDMLLVDGKISQIAPAIAAPEGATIVDAQGKQVYPGLIGMATTLGLVEVGAVRATRDSSEVGRMTPEVKAHIAFNADSEIIPTVRSNGVTHAQIAPGGRGLNGQSSLMQLDGWNWQDALVKQGTGMHLNWPSVGINKAFWESRTPEQQKKAQQKAAKQFEKSFSQIKAYAKARDENANAPVDLRWEAMRAVLKGDMPLYVNANDYRQIEQAVHFAEREALSLVIVGGRDADKAADLLIKHKVPVIYTSAWGRTWRSDEAMDRAFSMPALLESKGVQYALAIASDWPVRNLPFAAGQSIAYGASKEKALHSVTLAPAKILGVDDKMGSLTVGKQANLVISAGDLFDHLTHKVDMVLIDGRQIDIDNRHKRLHRKYSKKPRLN